MSIIISKTLSRDKQKTWYSFEWGKGKGQRVASGIFTYTKPKDQLQKNHNKEALQILETKRSHLIIDKQSTATSYIPQHKIKSNFIEYYAEFVKENSRSGNRHLLNSLLAFKKFIGKDYISPVDISETLCFRFRDYLLQNFNGETCSGYFMRFKRVLKAATKDGYFKNSPAEDLVAKTGAIKKVKEILTENEYLQLVQTPCLNHEVKKAFVFSLYSGLRWVDVKHLTWENIQDDVIVIQQKKTGMFLELPLHPIAKQIIGTPKTGNIFQLPNAEGAYKVLAIWCEDANVNKHITWHCARHSFSVILQLKGTDLATVAGMLGHTSTKYVQQTYRRYILNNAKEAIRNLPI